MINLKLVHNYFICPKIGPKKLKIGSFQEVAWLQKIKTRFSINNQSINSTAYKNREECNKLY